MEQDFSSRSTPKRLVVLVSGNGTNLQAILDAAHDERLDAEVSLVISNRPQAAALERAAGMGIPSVVLDHRTFASRDTFDQA
jgi:phosphoribosylglycinamide formyltransferase-1